MTNKKRIDAIVKGRVQGVCFRAFTEDVATGLGLTGEVKNLPDGTVRVIAEGEESDLKALIKKLHQGPSMAHVQDVSVNWENNLGQYNDFGISY